MVAPASGRLCIGQRHRHGTLVVSNFPELVSKGDCIKDRRCEVVSASGAVLFRFDLRRLYAWVRVEPNRVSDENADLYCVALIDP